MTGNWGYRHSEGWPRSTAFSLELPSEPVAAIAVPLPFGIDGRCRLEVGAVPLLEQSGVNQDITMEDLQLPPSALENLSPEDSVADWRTKEVLKLWVI